MKPIYIHQPYSPYSKVKTKDQEIRERIEEEELLVRLMCEQRRENQDSSNSSTVATSAGPPAAGGTKRFTPSVNYNNVLAFTRIAQDDQVYFSNDVPLAGWSIPFGSASISAYRPDGSSNEGTVTIKNGGTTVATLSPGDSVTVSGGDLNTLTANYSYFVDGLKVTASVENSYTVLTPTGSSGRSTVSIAGTYNASTASVGIFEGPGNIYECFLFSYHNHCSHTGRLPRVRMNCGAKPDGLKVYVKTWKYNWEDGSYTLIWKSEDVASQLTASGSNINVVFATASYIPEMGKCSLMLEYSESSYGRYSFKGVSSLYSLTEVSSSTEVTGTVSWQNIAGSVTGKGTYFTVNPFVEPPDIICFSDSRKSSSSNKWTAFTDDTGSYGPPNIDVTWQPEHHIRKKMGANVANYGDGGSQISTVLSNFTTYVFPAPPRIMIVLVGALDARPLSGDVTTSASYLSTLNKLVASSSMVTNPILNVFCTEWGFTDGTAEEIANITAYNNALYEAKASASFPDNILIVDTLPTMGVSPTSPMGLKSEYRNGTIHCNDLGHQVWGELVSSELSAWLKSKNLFI